jgi:hypothetical protein
MYLLLAGLYSEIKYGIRFENYRCPGLNYYFLFLISSRIREALS